MDLAQALLRKIIISIPAIIVIAFLLIILRYVYVKFGISTKLVNGKESFANQDFLPPPGSLGIASGKAPTPSDKPTNPTMEEFNQQVYGTTDTRVTPSVYSDRQGTYTYRYNTAIYTDANPEVRNITIIKNNAISSGVILTGTAQYAFMKHGNFLIHLEDGNQKVITSTVAYAQANPNKDMFVPWQARIGYVPPGSSPCTLVLENENYTGNSSLSKIIRLPVECR